MRRDDLDERALDVLGHALGVAADVEMRAFGEPAPQLRPDLAHAVLDVDFLVAVARPGEGEPGQEPRLLHGGELVLVEEVGVLALVAEEEPVPSRRPGRLPLAQEGAERRDAGARPDHDDRGRRVRRQREAVRLLDVELERGAGRDALGEEGRGDAEAAPLVDRVANGIDRESHPAGVGLGRGGDRVEPRLQGSPAPRRTLPGRAGPARISAAPQARRAFPRRRRDRSPPASAWAFPALLAAGHVGEELEQRVRAPVRDRPCARDARAASARPIIRSGRAPSWAITESTSDRMIGRKHAEAVADLVVEPARGKVDLDVPGLFLGLRRIEPAARQEDAFRRLFAGVPGSGCAGDRRRRSDTAAGAAGFASGSAASNSSASFFSARSVSLPPGAQRFSRSSFLRKSAFA